MLRDKPWRGEVSKPKPRKWRRETDVSGRRADMEFTTAKGDRATYPKRKWRKRGV